MDGVIVVDKPEGLTSHDVVAVARRALGERRIGHTGTLDPLATGVLPLACGRATRLVRFLTATDKAYEAEIRFGLATDTYDITGTPTRESAATPSRAAVEAALVPLRGSYLQAPPAYSAKKVGGQRAYALARRDAPVELTPVPVHVSRADLLALDGSIARVAITCTAGFYVRSFAHELGEAVGTGGCLTRLRRTRSGSFGLDRTVDLERLRIGSAAVADRWIAMEDVLPDVPAVHVTGEGRRRAMHGQEIEPAHWIAPRAGMPAGPSDPTAPADAAPWVRVVDAEGRLIAMATPGSRRDTLHAAVVLV